MPQLMKDVLCVIEAFHKYAREDGDETTLTCRELQRLIQDEFRDILQASVIRAVERNLNLLAFDSDGAISFDKFVLTIFNLMNLPCLDMRSLLNSEPRQVSRPEEKPADMDLQTTSRPGEWAGRTPPSKDKAELPPGIVSSAQRSPEERGPNRVHSQRDTKTHQLPGEASGHNDPENQHVEVNEQSQEATQGVQATGDEGAQNETDKPTAGSEQTGRPTEGEAGQDKDVPREGDKPAREPSRTEARDQTDKIGGNLGIRTSPSEETTQRQPENQEVAAERGVKEHCDIQEQSLQGKGKPRAEHADLPEQTAARDPCPIQKSADPNHDRTTAEPHEPGKDADRTPPETKNSTEPEINGRIPEIQKPPVQEKEHEVNNLPVEGDSRNVSETAGVSTEKKEKRGPEAHETAAPEESERKTLPPALEDDAQGGKYEELQETSKERDVEKRSKTQELSSEGGEQNHPQIEGTVPPGGEARCPEEETAQALVSSKNAPATEGTVGARERIWEVSPLENKSGGEKKRVTKTHDKPVQEDDGYKGEDPEPTVTQSDKGSPEPHNSLTPEDGDSISETGDLPGLGNSESQVDSLRESVQGGHNNSSDTQKQVALGEKNRTQEAVGREDEQLTKDQEQPDGEEHKSQASGTRGPGPAVEPDGHPEAETHLQTENLDTLEEEGKIPQELAGEGDDQQNPIPQSDLEEKTQRNFGPRSAGRGTANSSPLYKYLQEKILQQTDITEEKHQSQAQAAKVPSSELCNELSSEISGCHVFFGDS